MCVCFGGGTPLLPAACQAPRRRARRTKGPSAERAPAFSHLQRPAAPHPLPPPSPPAQAPARLGAATTASTTPPPPAPRRARGGAGPAAGCGLRGGAGGGRAALREPCRERRAAQRPSPRCRKVSPGPAGRREEEDEEEEEGSEPRRGAGEGAGEQPPGGVEAAEGRAARLRHGGVPAPRRVPSAAPGHLPSLLPHSTPTPLLSIHGLFFLLTPADPLQIPVSQPPGTAVWQQQHVFSPIYIYLYATFPGLTESTRMGRAPGVHTPQGLALWEVALPQEKSYSVLFP